MADLAETHKARDREEWERLAWHAANIMNCLGAKPAVTVKKLLAFLDPVAGEGGTEISPEERRAELDCLAAEHKKKFWTLLDDKYAKK